MNIARIALFAAGAATLSVFSSADVAGAQSYDHLHCFKVRDAKTFKAADVDLAALVPAFDAAGCVVRGGAKEFCVPVAKTVNAIEGGTDAPFAADSERYARVCYKLQCPKAVLAPELLTDQFGTRTVSGFKTTKLCTPAVLDSFPLDTTTTTFTTTTTSTTTSTTLTLDDTFDGSELDPSWSILNPGLATVGVSGGALHITPSTGGGGNLWFNDGAGVLVYRTVDGDFDVRSLMSVEDSDNPGSAPPPEYRLAGILVRDPASGPGNRNTAHVALGVGSAGQGVSYEYKSTDDSVSDWMTIPTPSRFAELRLARVGTVVTMYWRALPMDSWTVVNSFDRPDLPSTVHVGLMAYAASDPARIHASFDDVFFDVP